MKINDKVVFIGNEKNVYTIKKLIGHTAILKLPKELHVKLYPKNENSLIVDSCIARIDNLKIVELKQTELFNNLN